MRILGLAVVVLVCSARADRDGKILSIFNVVTIKRGPCDAGDDENGNNATGICMSRYSYLLHNLVKK